MAPLICHLGLPDASLYLFLKLYHKAELLIYLGTPHTGVCALTLHLRSTWHTWNLKTGWPHGVPRALSKWLH